MEMHLRDQARDADQTNEHAGDRRAHYQAGRARQAQQIEVLLNYPKVGPLDASAVAINLGSDRRHVAPVLEQLVRDGTIEQVEHDRYIGRDIRRAGGESPAPS